MLEQILDRLNGALVIFINVITSLLNILQYYAMSFLSLNSNVSTNGTISLICTLMIRNIGNKLTSMNIQGNVNTHMTYLYFIAVKQTKRQ